MGLFLTIFFHLLIIAIEAAEVGGVGRKNATLITNNYWQSIVGTKTVPAVAESSRWEIQPSISIWIVFIFQPRYLCNEDPVFLLDWLLISESQLIPCLISCFTYFTTITETTQCYSQLTFFICFTISQFGAKSSTLDQYTNFFNISKF